MKLDTNEWIVFCNLLFLGININCNRVYVTSINYKLQLQLQNKSFIFKTRRSYRMKEIYLNYYAMHRIVAE